MEKSPKLRKTWERKISPKQELQLAGWERFLDQQLGCYPAGIAALKLRMTTQGVYQASERGWITFFQVGRDRWYGRKDVITYRFERSRKFKDTRPQPSPAPKKFPL